jgi:single-stranded-DNA-specific exonuclease
MTTLFDVEQSLGRARWVIPQTDLSSIEQVVRTYDVPEVIARLLVSRGIPADKISSFLSPTLKKDFPDPFSLKGMKEVAEDLAQAIASSRKIAVFGDFDVDGAVSSALLCRFFRYFGMEVPVYIPDRLSEGYGPNVEALKKLKAQGAEIVIMVDCGTTAFEIVKQGVELGLEIIILDHHEAEDQLPAAKHVINPKRKDDFSGLDMMAACGVAFMTCVAINNKLREQGYYEKNKKPEAPVKDWLDIVALATICDMVPLTGVNRLLVRGGFGQMENTKNVGLRALMEVSGVKGAPTPYHAGFAFGPRINAGGRIHKADLGAKLLCTDDAEEAKNIAWTLNDCNDTRKGMQVEMERDAINMAEDQGLDKNPVIVVAHEEWHPGLVGLVAGRLKDKYGKPACVVAFTPNMDGVLEGRGSGRSVPGIHIAQAFIDARNEGLLEKGGGHAMAGGFTVVPDKLEALKEFLYAHIAKQAQSKKPNIETLIEGVLTVQGLRTDFVKMIEDNVGPFGQGFDEPMFALNNVRIHSADIVGGSHVRVLVSDWEGGARLKAVAFRAVGTELGDALLKEGRKAFHLAGYLKINSWQGRESVEMHIRDAAFAIMAESQKLAG